MITSVTSSTDTSSASSTMKSSLGMDSAGFMKLFIAQLQYQDPLKPQDASAMLEQLSQLTLVEQSYNTSKALNNLITAQNNSAAINSVSFVGGTVKAYGTAVNYDGSTSPTLKYNLSTAASTATLTIKNAAGNTVRTVSLSDLPAGDGSYTWDGCNSTGSKQSAGAYTFSLSGTTSSGTSATVTTYTTGVVDGVSFTNNTPYLKIGNVSVPITDVISVGAS